MEDGKGYLLTLTELGGLKSARIGFVQQLPHGIYRGLRPTFRLVRKLNRKGVRLTKKAIYEAH